MSLVTAEGKVVSEVMLSKVWVRVEKHVVPVPILFLVLVHAFGRCLYRNRVDKEPISNVKGSPYEPLLDVLHDGP